MNNLTNPKMYAALLLGAGVGVAASYLMHGDHVWSMYSDFFTWW